MKLQSSRTILRTRRVLVHIRMLMTSVVAIRQNITRMRPSVSRLAGLTKLGCIPGGGSTEEPFNTSSIDAGCAIIRLAHVYRSSVWWTKHGQLYGGRESPTRSSRSGTFSTVPTCSDCGHIIRAPSRYFKHPRSNSRSLGGLHTWPSGCICRKSEMMLHDTCIHWSDMVLLLSQFGCIIVIVMLIAEGQNICRSMQDRRMMWEDVVSCHFWFGPFSFSWGPMTESFLATVMIECVLSRLLSMSRSRWSWRG